MIWALSLGVLVGLGVRVLFLLSPFLSCWNFDIHRVITAIQKVTPLEVAILFISGSLGVALCFIFRAGRAHIVEEYNRVTKAILENSRVREWRLRRIPPEYFLPLAES